MSSLATQVTPDHLLTVAEAAAIPQISPMAPGKRAARSQILANLVDKVAYETNQEIGGSLLPSVAQKKEELSWMR